MADAAALADLGAVLLWAGAFILASLAYVLARAVAGSLGHVPLIGSGIEHAIQSAIVSPLNDLRKAADAGIAKGLSGLLDSTAVIVGLFLALGLGVKDALSYLWTEALAPRVHSLTVAIKTTADKALARVGALEATVAANVTHAEQYARSRASAAERAAERYADAAVADAVRAIRSEFGRALDQLRAAEDAAVTHAMSVAAAGITAAEHEAEAARAAIAPAVAAGVAEAEHVAEAAVQTAEQKAAQALAQAQALSAAAIADVKSVAVTAEDELTTVLGNLSAKDAAELLATIPALGTLVYAIATEAGLGNPECRGKVKGICATNPSAWADLLGGLAALGFVFSLRELHEIAVPLVGGLADVIREAA